MNWILIILFVYLFIGLLIYLAMLEYGNYPFIILIWLLYLFYPIEKGFKKENKTDCGCG